MKFEVGRSAILIWGLIFFRNVFNPPETFESQPVSTFLIALGIVVIFIYSISSYLVTILSMNHGLPIIGSEAVDGIYRNSGLVIRDDDPEVWASKIGDLLEDPERWTKMSNSGPLESTIFDSMKVRNQWLELYNSIVNTRSR